MIRFFIIAASGILAASTASAQSQAEVDKRLTMAYKQCLNNAGGYALTNCMNEELDRQDKALNQRYKAVMAKLTKPKQADLRNRQRQWIKDRDAKCELQQTESGVMSAQPWIECQIDEKVKRIIWLEKYR